MASLIGQRIRELRTKAGLTQTDLARGIVTPSMISQIEAGKAQPSPGLLKKLANRLQVSEPELYVEKSLDVTIQTRLRVLLVCSELGLHEEALQLAREVEIESAAHWQIAYARSAAALHSRQFAEAVRHIRQAQRLAAVDQQAAALPELFAAEGDAYLAAGDPKVALHAYRQARLAMRNQPPSGAVADVALTLRLARAFAELEDPAPGAHAVDEAAEQMAAKEHARNAARSEARFAYETLSSADAGHAAHAAEQAAALRQIARWIDVSAATCIALAKRLMQTDDFTAAAAQLEKCRTRQDDWSASVRSRALFVSAEIKLRTGFPDKWASLIEEAIALRPESPSVERVLDLLHAAGTAAQNGQPGLAVRIAQAALDEAHPLGRPDIETRAVQTYDRLKQASVGLPG